MENDSSSPPQPPFRADPDSLNKLFSSTAERTLDIPTAANHDLFDVLERLPDSENSSFQLREVSHSEVLRELKRLRADCSTGADQIPVKFLKSVAEYLASPLTHIINTCINSSYFPKAWKVARISLIPKVNNPKSNEEYRPVS